MGHAEDLIEGNGIDFNKKNAINGSNENDVKQGNESERNAIRKENIVRKNLQMEERKYDYYPLNK